MSTDATAAIETLNIDSLAGSGLKSYTVDLSTQPALQGLSGTSVTFILALDENLNKDADERRHLIDKVVVEGDVTP